LLYVDLGIWGTEETPVTWPCPYDAKENTVGTLCLDNKKTRSVIRLIKKLVEFCIPAPDRKTWTTTIDYHESAIEILLRHKDLNPELPVEH
jgi:hypothetical protein